MDKCEQITKFLLNEIRRLEREILEAEKRRKKYLYLEEINKLKHYQELYRFVINLH